MRIDFLFGGAFWGIVFILFGVAAILKTYDIHLPLFRVLFAIVFIYIGIAILTGGPTWNTPENTTIFNNIDIKVTDHIQDEYNIIFGKGIIDLTDIQPQEKWTDITVNTIFGSGKIIIDSSKPIKLKVSSVFAGANLPDGNSVTFGDYNTTYNGDDESKKYIDLEASVVFGNLEIKDINQ